MSGLKDYKDGKISWEQTRNDLFVFFWYNRHGYTIYAGTYQTLTEGLTIVEHKIDNKMLPV